MFDFLSKLFGNKKYRSHPEAMIISCFYNPQNNPYRLLAFQKFYSSIKHMNYRIIECIVGDASPQLPTDDSNILRVKTPTLLWHKEALLNKLIRTLPPEIKYVFWVDADVLFVNKNWMVNAVHQMQNGIKILQPFEYCIHLERNQLSPEFDVDEERHRAGYTGYLLRPNQARKKMWRSYCSNVELVPVHPHILETDNYDMHGHVGFAWGAQREVLEECPLYSKALVGGADHIIAHAATGHIPHRCIEKSFTENLEEIVEWSKKFFAVVQGRVGYVPGDLYHIWHGDIQKRQYFSRIRDFTKNSKKISEVQDDLYVAPKEQEEYVRDYMNNREVPPNEYSDYGDLDSGFSDVMGYVLSELMSSSKPLIEEPAESIKEPAESLPAEADDVPLESLPAEADDPGVSFPVEPNFS